MNSELSNDIHFESKGFMSPINVTDFPIRDHKVILVIRRRRWTDLRTGKSFSLPINEILNFYNNRSTNAAAESFNAKIKLFRANLHGVTDKKFFLFRIAKLYGYPH